MPKILNYFTKVFVLFVFVALKSYGQDFPTTPNGELHLREIGANMTSEELANNTLRINFEINLAKTDYLLNEPVILNIRYSNPTNDTLTFFCPTATNNLGIKLVENGQILQYRKAMTLGISGPLRLCILKSGEVKEEISIIESKDVYFKNFGNYEVQFYLTHLKEKRLTPPTPLRIYKPVGVDNEALDFILKNFESRYGLFGVKPNESMKSRNLLEEFTNRFNNSIYYQYGILRLSSMYIENNELEKAKETLLKINNTPNSLIKKLVEQTLSEVDKVMKKMNNPNRPQ